MFQWDKSVNAINIPASKVVQLFRSMREVQLALPGVSAQQASAYLCQYLQEGGIATTVVFHLHKKHILAFYYSDPRVVPEQKTDSMLDQGLNFVESMGFLMTDQDIHLLEQADQEMLWSSLPLTAGLQDDGELPRSVTSPGSANAEIIPDAEGAPGISAVEQTPQSPAPAVASKQAKPVPAETSVESKATVSDETPGADDNVNDLLAAVDAMRAKRPGLRARKAPPSAEEIQRRRLQLCQNIGRILASL